MYGWYYSSEIGTVRRNASGDLELLVDPNRSDLSSSRYRPVAVIKDPEGSLFPERKFDPDCEDKVEVKETDALDLEKRHAPVRTEIFSTDSYGRESRDEFGAAVIECE